MRFRFRSSCDPAAGSPRLAILTAAITLCLTLPASGAADIYQYAAEAETAGGDEMTAYLWVPPQAERIRGVLIGGSATSVEPVFAADEHIRRVCAEHDLAIVLFTPHVDAVFQLDDRDPNAKIDAAMEALAEVSGRDELTVAPLFPFGHSVSSVYASLFTQQQPERIFGALLHKGGIVLHDDEARAAMAGVPVLAIKGQFEEFGPGPHGVLRDHEDRETAWKTMRDTLKELREQHDDALVSLLVEPGATHFAWSPRYAAFVADFIAAAAEARIPDCPADATAPVTCRELDPADGALSSFALESEGQPTAADYQDYEGDRAEAMWHLNTGLAAAAEEMHELMYTRRAQFVAFAHPDHGRPVMPGHDLRVRYPLHWTGPGEFTADSKFIDRAPDKYPSVDDPITHADGEVRLRTYGGQAEKVDDATFRIKLNPRRRMEANLLAYHPGDETYRYAEQGAILRLPERVEDGKAQSITFPEIDPIRVGAEPVALEATSDSDLPVSYYIERGPAVIEDGTLRLADVPEHGKLPPEIVVVAWQYGSAVEPRVKTAERVEQRIELLTE